MFRLQLRFNKARISAGLLVMSMLLQTGCGTLLYPERRGQTSGRIDPAVAIMNGLGLLLFLIPGIIAFIVDFSTGAIYLPSEDGQAAEPVAYLPPDEMTPERIAEVIRERTGVEVMLTEEDLRVMRVEDVGAIRGFREARSGHSDQP